MSSYDPNYGYKPELFRLGTKTILKKSDGEILLLKRSDKTKGKGLWSLPGGGVEKNESPKESAMREIKEETGLKVDKLELVDINFHRSAVVEKKSLLTIGFIGLVSLGQEVKLNWEHSEYKFLTKEEALKLDLTEDGRFFIENFNS